MTPEHAQDGAGEYPEFDDLVRELDAILEAWFMQEVAPALDDARASREALDALVA